MKNIWKITGDTHGDFSRFYALNRETEAATATYNVIILGDAGVNFWLSKRDRALKKQITENYPNLIFYLVRGNHEQRPELIEGMDSMYVDEIDNYVFSEHEFPNIRYLLDGEIYNINGLRTLICGGAYSVDKDYRLARQEQGLYGGWFEEEQLNETERNTILIDVKNEKIDMILAHTCPFSWMPRDLFLPFIDQRLVDNSMEIWLEEVVNTVRPHLFLCGHYHDDRILAHGAEMLYGKIKNLDDIIEFWKE
jgi:3-oxoacid CoA-transferase subunit A